MTTTVYSQSEVDAKTTAQDQKITAQDQKITALEARVKKLEDAGTVTPPPVTDPNLYDDFKYTFNFPVGGLSPNGKWKCEYVSQGSAKTDGTGLVMVPGGTTLTEKTGSAMVRSTKTWANFRATLDITCEKQVYANPPQWQCSWLIFRHLDKWRHWYVYFGLNHMEIGRKDAPTNITDQAEIEKYQFILWGGGPGTPVGTKRKVVLEFMGTVLKLTVDGQLIVTLNDNGTLKNQNGVTVKTATFTSGQFAPYTEGSQSRYGPVTIETL